MYKIFKITCITFVVDHFLRRVMIMHSINIIFAHFVIYFLDSEALGLMLTPKPSEISCCMAQSVNMYVGVVFTNAKAMHSQMETDMVVSSVCNMGFFYLVIGMVRHETSFILSKLFGWLQ